MDREKELSVERLAEDPWLVLHHTIPADADPQFLKAARAAAVVCRFVSEDLITHRHDDPHFRDLKQIDAILADISNRLGDAEPEPEPIPLNPDMEATLEKLEQDW
jgi:hypothetical protein